MGAGGAAMEALESAGRRLLLGPPPGPLGASTLALLEATGALGLLLFRSHLTEPAALPEQLLTLRQQLGRPLVVAVDHEGGQVLRH
ncbi:MAG: hypothetical protein IGQ88_03625, partial [Gloeomargaritaceae cyanobacterium C42_A2020_066]|nr:hypothetical protein [Gloeomargaritaceae cyanobacterium C42_A2020_066]